MSNPNNPNNIIIIKCSKCNIQIESNNKNIYNNDYLCNKCYINILLSNKNKVNLHVEYDKVNDKVNHKLEDKVENKIAEDKVENKIAEDKVENKIAEDKVENKIEDKIADKENDKIEDKIAEDKVENKIEDKIEDKIANKKNAKISDKENYKINAKIYNDEEDEDLNEDEDEDEEYEEDEEEYDEEDDGEEKNVCECNVNCYENINNINNNYNKILASIINNFNKIDKNNKIKYNYENEKKNKDDKNDNVNSVNDLDKDKYEDKDNENEDITLEYEWLGLDIKNINDLIRIGNTYNPKKRKRYNLNLKKLNKLVLPLTELQNMIGMTEIKKIIFDQIIYYLQKLDDKNVDMLHTVIVGPPGVGKTQLTHIIAKIYNKLGFLKTDNVICAKRDDLIGEYIGQTAPKTRKVLEKALGGVLLLDEVYSLSPNSEKDFAREAIDMINMYLSEHSHDLVCVIAGYKKPTYENFLAYNQGLARRFTHHFEIKGYNSEELTLIFKKYVEEQKWSLMSSNELIIPIIAKNIKLFPNYGGDMTTLFACCKKTHSKRLLLIPTENELNETKKKITIVDIEQGIKLFIDIKEKSSNLEDEKDGYMNMYS